MTTTNGEYDGNDGNDDGGELFEMADNAAMREAAFRYLHFLVKTAPTREDAIAVKQVLCRCVGVINSRFGLREDRGYARNVLTRRGKDR